MILLESEGQNVSEYRPAPVLGTHAQALGYRACCKKERQDDDEEDGDGDNHETQLYKYLHWA